LANAKKNKKLLSCTEQKELNASGPNNDSNHDGLLLHLQVWVAIALVGEGSVAILHDDVLENYLCVGIVRLGGTERGVLCATSSGEAIQSPFKIC